MLNYHLLQKIKLIGKSKFNHLTITLTASLKNSEISLKLYERTSNGANSKTLARFGVLTSVEGHMYSHL
jgi:hypothetical protein